MNKKVSRPSKYSAAAGFASSNLYYDDDDDYSEGYSEVDVDQIINVRNYLLNLFFFIIDKTL